MLIKQTFVLLPMYVQLTAISLITLLNSALRRLFPKLQFSAGFICLPPLVQECLLPDGLNPELSSSFFCKLINLF